METVLWLSAAVEKTWLFLAGMVVLRSMTLVMTPPRVSTPSDKGVTSKRRTSFTSPFKTPALDGGADGDHFIRVDALVGFLLEEILHGLLRPRAYGSSHPPKPPRGYPPRSCPASFKALRQGSRVLSTIVADQLFQLGAGKLDVQMLRPRGVRRDKGQVDVGLVAWSKDRSSPSQRLPSTVAGPCGRSSGPRPILF